MVDTELLARFIELHAEDVAKVLEQAEAGETQAFLAALSTPQVVSIIRHMNVRSASRYLENCASERVAEIIRELPVNHAANLLRGVSMRARKALLARTDIASRVKTRVSFPRGSVGAAMDSDCATLKASMTVKQSRAFLQRHRDAISDPLFIVDAEQRLVGAIKVQDLLLADDTARLDLLRQPCAYRLAPRATLARAHDSLAWRQDSAMPVAGRDGRLLGVLRSADLQEAMAFTDSAEAPYGVGTLFAIGELFWETCATVLPGADTSRRMT